MLENGRVLLSDKDFETIYLVRAERYGRGNIIHNESMVIGEVDNTQRKLLELLASNPGVSLDSGEIIRTIWPSFGLSDGIKALRVGIYVLRKRLADANTLLGDNIETVHGFGYRWRDGLLEPIDDHAYCPTSDHSNSK